MTLSSLYLALLTLIINSDHFERLFEIICYNFLSGSLSLENLDECSLSVPIDFKTQIKVYACYIYYGLKRRFCKSLFISISTSL